MVELFPRIRLYIDPEACSPLHNHATIVREGDAAHYLTRVMRLKEGDAVALFNRRDGEWRADITHIEKKRVQLQVQAQLRVPLAGPDVWVCFAPIKFGRIDYLAQKLTELGAAKLQPVISQYTQSDKVNLKRLGANAIEAAEQCERVDVPEVAEPVSLPQLLANWPADRPLLWADESGAGGLSAEILENKADKWAILIGPEGGFSPQERELIAQQSFGRGVSLGPRILRADTAAITLLSLTMAAWGDWDIKPRFIQDD